ncbi:bifunctional transcriptional activator/DNA repair enzyme AdaA [Litoribrevibacter euphylliae]|uniref:Bifunctional transcriptional activator/DNA repair enzyme AdaA n=1 Tax=Litoribrevibacter euphylliae TaxID=1834034 RepID=A0ABV7HKP7_9GAMM
MILESPIPKNKSLSQAKNYQRIEQAIAFLRANFKSQPSLEEVAAHVHLSEYHFQKMFKEWAGISPKQFNKHLTLEFAKQQLAAKQSVVDTAFESGLSGSGRLHDLFVTLEAVTPGEFAKIGEGIEIRYGIHPTPFGFLFMAVTERGVCQLTFIDSEDDDSAFELLKSTWKHAVLVEDQSATFGVAECLFQNTSSLDSGSEAHPIGASIHLLAKGTNFQVQVWKALLNLPYGSVTSYQRVADALGKPKAVRAVASAIGANPLAYLIPCHRVLRGTGELGGYRWGLDRKSALLMWEAAG